MYSRWFISCLLAALACGPSSYAAVIEPTVSLGKKKQPTIQYLQRGIDMLSKQLSFASGEMTLSFSTLACYYFSFCEDTSIGIVNADASVSSVGTKGNGEKQRNKSQKPKRYTMLDGKDIFVEQCASCHLAARQDAPQLANFDDWSWRIQSSLDFLVQVTILGRDAYEKKQQDSASQASRFVLDSVETVSQTPYDSRIRGCALPRGGCDACNDAQIIAVVKYMVQSAAPDNANYQLW